MFFGGGSLKSLIGLDKTPSSSSSGSSPSDHQHSPVASNLKPPSTEQQPTTSRRKSFSEMLHRLIADDETDDAENDEENNEEIEINIEQEHVDALPPNNIGIEFTIGTVTLANDMSFTQYFRASIFDTCITFSVKRSDEQEELFGDDYKPTIVHSSRIRKSPLSDGFSFKWKGEKVILPIQLSDIEFQQVMNICYSNSNNMDGSHHVFEHSSSVESKKILPKIAIQLDNISSTSEMIHNYIMKCKPHVNFIGEAVYDINRLMDFRSRSVDTIELSLKRGKDKTGIITIGMKLILPHKVEIEKPIISNSPEGLHNYETISFDDSFILSGLRKKLSSERLTSICDSNFDVPQNNSENLYEETHYEILEEVGRGSFGKVFKAMRKSDKTIVGIKKINCDNINNANDALVEFWPIRKISYPQLISIQDIYFSKSDDEFSSLFNLCLVMEYMDCGDLEQFIIAHKEQGQSIQEPHLLSLMIQIAAGLNHLHLNGLLHRDIKGKNILLGCKFKECKIGDFGLIYNLRSLTSKNLNDTISGAGTIKYQSPECHIGVKDITELDSSKQTTPYPTSLFMNYIYSSDIWSLGVVFLELIGCEMLTFSPYIMAMKDPQQFQELIKTRCNRYHKDFSNLIISMLSLEPKDRPDSEKLVRTLLNLKKELFGQQRSVKIHPVIEIHRQLLSVGKSVKGMFLSATNNNAQSDPVSDNPDKSSRRTLSLHSVKDFLSGIHKVVEEEDTPTPESCADQNNSSTNSLNRDVFSFGLW